jgi:putative methionine-R-sulfoxide reductase with GAF domain
MTTYFDHAPPALGSDPPGARRPLRPTREGGGGRRCHTGLTGYRWVGIYQVDETEASILGWSGPGAPSHPSFPVTQGLTGAAIRSRSTIVSDDVAKDPRYLTTFGSTRSEMIVPIFNALGTVVGTIDIESDRIAAFLSEDRALVEACAGEILSVYEGESFSNIASSSEAIRQPSSPRLHGVDSLESLNSSGGTDEADHLVREKGRVSIPQ